MLPRSSHALPSSVARILVARVEYEYVLASAAHAAARRAAASGDSRSAALTASTIDDASSGVNQRT